MMVPETGARDGRAALRPGAWEARTTGRRVSANVERGRQREMGRGRDYWLPIGTVLMTRTQPTWLSAVRTLIQVVPPESVA